mmetsp:Transcript_53240/g.150059  ORF Transcript_53240/g.150059 Transcript_53240/m.150059 type:complete len:127 (+) Transcript_53240:41-421(+)
MNTKSHYGQLAELGNEFRDAGLRILAFPCKQFLNQEHDKPCLIKQRSSGLGFEGENFQLMATVCVKGPDTSPVFAYLQAKTGKQIGWNFGVYFLVGRNGAIEGHKNVAPKKLRDRIQALVGEDVAE